MPFDKFPCCDSVIEAKSPVSPFLFFFLENLFLHKKIQLWEETTIELHLGLEFFLLEIFKRSFLRILEEDSFLLKKIRWDKDYDSKIKGRVGEIYLAPLPSRVDSYRTIVQLTIAPRGKGSCIDRLPKTKKLISTTKGWRVCFAGKLSVNSCLSVGERGSKLQSKETSRGWNHILR